MIDIYKLRHWAIILFLFICPIIYSTNPAMDLRQMQERAFQLGVIALFALFVGNLWIGAFLLLNIVSILLNDWNVGLTQVLNVFFGCVLFSLSRSYFKKNDSAPYLRILLWVGVLNLGWIIFQMNGIDPINIGQSAAGVPQFGLSFRDTYGLFGIKMAAAIFIGIMLPIVASINLWLLPFFIVPMYLMRSSVACVSILVSIGFYLYHLHRKLFLGFVIATSILGSAYIIYDFKDDPSTFKSRFPMWHAAFKYSLLRPIGYGPDSFRNYTKQKDFQFYSDYDYNTALLTRIDETKAQFKYYEMDNGKMAQKNKALKENGLKNSQLNWWDNPHNEYVKHLFEYGFIGLFLLVGLIRELILRFKFSNKSKEIVVLASILLVYAVSSLGHFPFHLARLACFAAIILGAFVAKTDATYEFAHAT